MAVAVVMEAAAVTVMAVAAAVATAADAVAAVDMVAAVEAAAMAVAVVPTTTRLLWPHYRLKTEHKRTIVPSTTSLYPSHVVYLLL